MQDYKIIFKALGALWILLACSMCIPLLVGVYYGDSGVKPLAVSACAAFIAGVVLLALFRKAKEQFRKRGAFLFVSLTWFTATVFGALPFYLSGVCDGVINSWFEAASGFTTTGATVLTGLEDIAPSIILWRSLTQFLGGMGIIVLSLAVLPLLGVGGMDLYRAEAPGPTSDKITARVSETAKALWLVYLLFAFIEAILLWFFGMTPFEAVNHSFTTMATGGFSTRDASIAGFNSAAIEGVITFFMFCAAANFLLHFRLIVRRDALALRDREFRFFLIISAMAVFLVTMELWYHTYPSFWQALRYGAFQVGSLISTTGYASADYLTWGFGVQAILISLMVVGGCAGSTAGGVKCIRGMMLIKQGYRELFQMIHPKAKLPLKVGKQSVPPQVSSAIFGFFFLYVLLVAVSGLVVTGTGVDLITAYSAVVSALSNVGPGLGEVGPALNYAGLPALAKVPLASCMIVGRLEIMTVLVLFTKGFWTS